VLIAQCTSGTTARIHGNPLRNWLGPLCPRKPTHPYQRHEDTDRRARNGTEVIFGDVFLDKGVIVAVGYIPEHLLLPQDLQIIDAEGKRISPGLVDAHSHLGGLFRTCIGRSVVILLLYDFLLKIVHRSNRREL
jgi:hypothetical protein